MLFCWAALRHVLLRSLRKEGAVRIYRLGIKGNPRVVIWIGLGMRGLFVAVSSVRKEWILGIV